MSEIPENLRIYEAVREPPKEALKDFTRPGGFKGTDINAMWRIKMLTEQFGPCGFGWYIESVKKWIEQYDVRHVKCFVDINLYIKVDGVWSKPIVGNGGNDWIFERFNKNSQKNDLIINDECFKMAETDALGSACKKIGMAANVYWSSDKSKYTMDENDGTIIESAPMVEGKVEEKPKRSMPKDDPFFGKPAPKKTEVQDDFVTGDMIVASDIPPEAEMVSVISVKGAQAKYKDVVKNFKIEKGAKSNYDLSYNDKVELYTILMAIDESDKGAGA